MSSAIVSSPFELVTLSFFRPAPSSPPLGVDVVDTFATNFTVVWTPPPSHTHNGIIVGYQLNTTELETGRSFVRETSQLSYTFFHLHPFYTYQFTLSAVTVSPGPVSPVVEVVTLETGNFDYEFIFRG